MPGQVRAQGLAPMGFDETMAMLNATAPKSPIQAPKDRGMFGRFKNILAGGKYGEEQMGWVERLGRGADGMNAIRDEQRALKMAQEEEVKRREIAESMGMYDGQAGLFAMDPATALAERRDARNFQYQQGRDAKEDDRFERQWLRDENRFETELEFRERVQGFTEQNADRNFGLQQDQFGLQQNQFGWQVGTDARDFTEGQRQFDMTYGLNRDKLTAETAAEGAGVAPALAGLPPGVQSAIVTKELGGLDASEEAVGKARSAANIARSFMADSKGYGSLGGGPLADIGQAASQKTAQLKGHTARMIPMMRSPGEGEMTDSDAKRYELSVVSINKGRSANEAVVRDLERFEANEVARDKFLREWQAQNGYGSVSQAKLLWQQYADAEPIFDPETGKARERRDIYTWMNSQGADDDIEALVNQYSGGR
jgi:hypothetical protein